MIRRLFRTKETLDSSEPDVCCGDVCATGSVPEETEVVDSLVPSEKYLVGHLTVYADFHELSVDPVVLCGPLTIHSTDFEGCAVKKPSGLAIGKDSDVVTVVVVDGDGRG